MRGCDCCDQSTTREEMEQRHGTPESFEAAVWRALGEITYDEYLAAVRRYRRQWWQAPA